MTLLADACIIIVEDDYNARLITQDLLRLAGVTQCYSRKSVGSALSFAEKQEQVDLFLVDINMPGQSGYDLLAAVRDHARLKNAKVVAVTAGTLSDDVAKARDLNFDGFISKPLKTEEFAKQVQTILNGKRVWDTR